MADELLFRNLEQALVSRPDLTVWWRDDDINYIGLHHPLLCLQAWQRLNFIGGLLAKSKVPSLLAVVPWQFLEKARALQKLLDAHDVPLAIHGIRHTNHSPFGKSEFPPEKAGPETCHEILKIFSRFRQWYGSRLLPVFVPPFNTIAPRLARMLLDNGIAISVSNSGPGLACNTDYDFVDWKRRRLLPHKKIVTDIIDLINNGSPFLGINSHHKLIDSCDRPFIEGLVNVLDAHAQSTCNTKLPFRVPSGLK